MEDRLKGCLMERKGVIIEPGEQLRVDESSGGGLFFSSLTNNIYSFTVSSLYLVTVSRDIMRELVSNFIPPVVCTK